MPLDQQDRHAGIREQASHKAATDPAAHHDNLMVSIRGRQSGVPLS